MHTMSVTVDGTEYFVNHHSDWSGEAHVNWTDRDGDHEIRLPGMLLRACGRSAAIGDAISAIERLTY